MSSNLILGTMHEEGVVDIEALRGVREGPIGRRIVVVAIASVAAIVMIVMLAVALAPPRPPGSVLTGTTWRWTGATTGPAELPLVVPDPSRYTVEFRPDWTFSAAADCTAVSGTYVRVLAGRTGSPWTGLRLQTHGSIPVPCGPDSLSDAFLQGLSAASRYLVADSELTISLSTGGAMTFEVGGPAGNASGAPG
jgi:hypothetical protein